VLRAIGAALALVALPGCVAVTVAAAAVSVGATVVEAAVDVTVGAVKLTGKAVSSAVDAITDNDPGPKAPAQPQPAK